MNNLRIEKTNETPLIDFGVKEQFFKIEGRSLPENAITFYNPILAWLNEFVSDHKSDIILEINLEYFNSASSKQIFNILLVLNEYYKKQGEGVKIKWLFDQDDELIEEEGREFEEMLDIPFEFIAQ